MKSLTSGTVILNHTIKNEVSKISIMKNIQNSTADAMKDQPEILDVNENIKSVNDSIEYLSVMINKIRKQVKDIVLEECKNNLGDIIDKAVDLVLPYLKSRNITVHKNYGNNLNIICDSVHLWSRNFKGKYSICIRSIFFNKALYSKLWPGAIVLLHCYATTWREFGSAK